jgi:hypothetical protein
MSACQRSASAKRQAAAAAAAAGAHLTGSEGDESSVAMEGKGNFRNREIQTRLNAKN